MVVIAPLGIEGFVIQLGVLFAGRVCAPLETTMPADRLAGLIESIRGPVICLDEHLTTELADHGISCLDSSALRLDASSDAGPMAPPIVSGDGDSAALLCFTSGSTGNPKGVLIPHAQLLEAAAFAGSVQEDVVAITSPPSFFASMLQTLTSLIVGGTGVHLDLASHSAVQLHQPALDVGLTHFTGTTTHVRELARASEGAPILSLRAIDLGGEATTATDITDFHRAFPHARIRNIYGSSETGRITTLDIGPDEQPETGTIAAGRPDGNRLLRLLGDDDRPVPDGRVGRIAVHRPQPFLGYWHDPELTASRVVVDSEGREWILSGDRGHLDDNGLLHVVGRTDDLVKIRGRFVDVADIDSILRNDPRVAHAVTVAVPLDAPVRLHTIAVANDPDLTESDVRNLLRASLPLFAMPRHIIFVDEIPVTDRGKPDRDSIAGIPVPNVTSRTSRPANDLERILVQEVSDLLSRDIGVRDDFFAVGGDSLAAIELLATIEREFGVTIAPTQFSADPTPAGLAAMIKRGETLASPSGLQMLFASDDPTSVFWFLGGHDEFGPVRVARRIAPVQSSCVRVVGTTNDHCGPSLRSASTTPMSSTRTVPVIR